MRFDAERGYLLLDEHGAPAERVTAGGFGLDFDGDGRLVGVSVPDADLHAPAELRAEHDPEAGAAYLYLQTGSRIADTLSFAHDADRPAWGINLDFDRSGRLAGIEFESAAMAPPSLLEAARRI